MKHFLKKKSMKMEAVKSKARKENNLQLLYHCKMKKLITFGGCISK